MIDPDIREIQGPHFGRRRGDPDRPQRPRTETRRTRCDRRGQRHDRDGGMAEITEGLAVLYGVQLVHSGSVIVLLACGTPRLALLWVPPGMAWAAMTALIVARLIDDTTDWPGMGRFVAAVAMILWTASLALAWAALATPRIITGLILG